MWYHVCKISFFIFIGLLIVSSVPLLFSLPAVIVIVTTIVAVTIIPAIGYVIYGLSKEKYF